GHQLQVDRAEGAVVQPGGVGLLEQRPVGVVEDHADAGHSGAEGACRGVHAGYYRGLTRCGQEANACCQRQFLLVTFVAPCLRKSVTISLCPFRSATASGVENELRESDSRASASACLAHNAVSSPNASSSACTISKWPFSAARCRAVSLDSVVSQTYLILDSSSLPNVASRRRTTGVWPLAAARNRAVPFDGFFAFGSVVAFGLPNCTFAPRAIRPATTGTFPFSQACSSAVPS